MQSFMSCKFRTRNECGLGLYALDRGPPVIFGNRQLDAEARTCVLIWAVGKAQGFRIFKENLKL